MSWREELERYIAREAKPAEKYGHQPRLYALATRIGQGLEYDDDVVFAAIWLHDLGVFYGHRPEDLEELKRWDNTNYAMERSPAILEGLGFPVEKIAAVVEAIRTHQTAGNPTSLEGMLIRDADILEQLGAIGILRTVCKVGRDTRFSTFSDAVKSLEKALASLPGQLRLDGAMALAKERVAEHGNFLTAVAQESGGLLY